MCNEPKKAAYSYCHTSQYIVNEDMYYLQVAIRLRQLLKRPAGGCTFPLETIVPFSETSKPLLLCPPSVTSEASEVDIEPNAKFLHPSFKTVDLYSPITAEIYI